MGNKGLLKRMLPFFATFAFGIFVASFFVSVGSTSSYNSYGRGKCRHEMRGLRYEYEQQREEIRQLREQLDEAQTGTTTFESELPLDVTVPLPPPPPPVGLRHRTHK